MSQSKGFTQSPAVLFIPEYWTGHSHLRCLVPSFHRLTTVLVQHKTKTCISENCESTWPSEKISSHTQATKIRSKLQNPFPRQHLSWNTIVISPEEPNLVTRSITENSSSLVVVGLLYQELLKIFLIQKVEINLQFKRETKAGKSYMTWLISY